MECKFQEGMSSASGWSSKMSTKCLLHLPIRTFMSHVIQSYFCGVVRVEARDTE